MSKPRKQYKPRGKFLPVLVAQNFDTLETAERAAVQAIATGSAGVKQHDNLADCCDLLKFGAEKIGFNQSVKVSEFAEMALLNIKERYFKSGKIGCTGEERKALELLADESNDFWKRQSGRLFHFACAKLTELRKKQSAEFKAKQEITV